MPLPTQYWPVPITELVTTVKAAGRELHVDVSVDGYDASYTVTIRVPRESIARAKARADRP